MTLAKGDIKTINWSLFGQKISGTLVIALSFLFIAYLLEPIVEGAFHRIRAYRAWHNLEDGQLVEVTNYALHDEILRGRKKWDAARMITVMLLAFSAATWVLELNLRLYNVGDGPVDLLDRPPPVVLRNSSDDSEHWNVTKRTLDGDGGGLYGNFDGDYDNGNATSRYKVEGETYKGSILTAWWSNDHRTARPNLFFNASETGTATVSRKCTDPLSTGDVYKVEDGSGDKWGKYEECLKGQVLLDTCDSSPAMIILTDLYNVTHTIVEEDSNYPSFLYSVWKHSKQTTTKTDCFTNATDVLEIEHVFYIASKSRLVEAIITGIVNGNISGGACMDLLLSYSFNFTDEAYGRDQDRASPFGEHPGYITVARLDTVEPIERGVRINPFSGAACVLILFLCVIGVGASFFMRSKIGMDVYDRDELIKAVTLPDQVDGDVPQSAMRMYVKRDPTSRKLTVVISEDGVDEGLLRSALKLACCRRSPVQEAEYPASSNDASENGAPVVPFRPRQVVQLEGTSMRFAAQRAWTTDGSRGARHVILSASPASSVASTPTGGQDTVWPDANIIARRQMARAALEGESISTNLGSSMDGPSTATVGSSTSTQVNSIRGNHARNGLPHDSNGSVLPCGSDPRWSGCDSGSLHGGSGIGQVSGSSVDPDPGRPEGFPSRNSGPLVPALQKQRQGGLMLSPIPAERAVVDDGVTPARGDNGPCDTPDSLVGNDPNSTARRGAMSNIGSTPRRPFARPQRRDWAGDSGEVSNDHKGGFEVEGGGDVEEDRRGGKVKGMETVRSPPVGVADTGTETPPLPERQLVGRIDTVGPAEFRSLPHPEDGGDAEEDRGAGGVGAGKGTVRSPPAGVAVSGTETSPLPARQLVEGIDTVGPAEFRSLPHPEDGRDAEEDRGAGGVRAGNGTVRSPPAGVAVSGTETSPLPSRQLVGGIDTVGPAEFQSLTHPEPVPDDSSPDDPCDAV